MLPSIKFWGHSHYPSYLESIAFSAKARLQLVGILVWPEGFASDLCVRSTIGPTIMDMLRSCFHHDSMYLSNLHVTTSCSSHDYYAMRVSCQVI